MSDQPKTAECDKMVAISGQSQMLGSFLEWLGENGYIVGEPTGRSTYPYWPTNKNTETLLAQYFEIDLGKVEEERAAVLEWFKNVTS